MLVSCGWLKPDESITAAADVVYAEFVRGDSDGVVGRLPPDFDTPETRSTMVKARDFIPEGPAKGAKVLGHHTGVSPAGTQIGLTVGYDYGDRGVVFTTTWYRANDTQPWSLIGVHIDSMTPEQRKLPSLGNAALPPLKPAI